MSSELNLCEQVGRGTICIDNTRVTGLNTKFTTDLKAGAYIFNWLQCYISVAID